MGVPCVGKPFSTPTADGKREAVRRVFKDAAHPDVGDVGSLFGDYWLII